MKPNGDFSEEGKSGDGRKLSSSKVSLPSGLLLTPLFCFFLLVDAFCRIPSTWKVLEQRSQANGRTGN